MIPDFDKNRIEVIDFLRGISILAVLAAHTGTPASSLAITNLWERIWFRVFSNGNYGVSIFFVLSGYVITRMIFLNRLNHSKNTLRYFYVRRIARLWPLLFLVIAAGFALLAFCKNAPAEALLYLKIPAQAPFGLFVVSLFTFSLNWLFLFYDGFGHYWGIMWSLAIEEQFYLLYPALLIKPKNNAPGKFVFSLLVFMILLGPLARAAEHWAFPHKPPVLINSFANFDLIAWGCLLFLVSKRALAFLNSKPWLWLKTALLPGGSLLLGAAYMHGHFFQFSLERVLAPTVMAAGICGIILGGEKAPVFDMRPAQWIASAGRLSYGIYLLHVPVIFMLWPLLKSAPYFTSFFIITAASAAAAWLSARYFEKPAWLWIVKTFAHGQRR